MGTQADGVPSMDGGVHNGHQSSGQPNHSAPAFAQPPGSLDPNASQPYNPALFGSAMPTGASDQYAFPDQTQSYLGASSQAFSQPGTLAGDFGGNAAAFKRNSVGNQQRPLPQHLNLQSSNHQFSTDFSNPFPTQGADNGFVLDPTLQGGAPQQQQNQSINPADIMGNVSPPDPSQSPSNNNNLMTVESRPSPHQSPSLQQHNAAGYSPGHSRHASLDPSSAGLPQGQHAGEWSGMLGGGYRHRRSPSDHSDISSVAASPYINQDTFDANHSPMLQPQQDSSAYQSTLGMERFTISEAQQQQQQQQQQNQQQQQHPGLSPRHSPYPSPRLSPNQTTPAIPDAPFILGSNDLGNGGYGGGPGPQLFTGPGGPAMQNSVDMAPAAQMQPPPEINVELAPPSRGVEPHLRGENDSDALSPPDRGTSLTSLPLLSRILS